jgi:hypothetical protein
MAAAVQEDAQVAALYAECVGCGVAIHALDVAQLDRPPLQLRQRIELATHVLEGTLAIEMVVLIMVRRRRIGRVVQRALARRAAEVIDQLVLQDADHPTAKAGAAVVRMEVLGRCGPSLLDEVGCEVIVADGATRVAHEHRLHVVEGLGI